MKILYFTTTGNSLAVARAIGDELFSLNSARISARFRWADDEAIGVVCPVYFGALPGPVADFLVEAELGAPYKFLILTCGTTPALALNAPGDWDYVRSIRMIDNYFPMFDVAKQIATVGRKHVDKNLREIVDDVSNRVRHRQAVTMVGRIAGWCMRLFPLSPRAYRRFYLEPDVCDGCGVCGRICPVDNIVMADVGPEFGSRCLTCGACYHNCPREAIRYRGEKSRVQYHHPGVTLRDMLRDAD